MSRLARHCFSDLPPSPPVGTLQFEHCLHSLGESRDVPASPERRRIAAPAGESLIFARGLARLGERGPSGGPEPDIALSAVNRQPLNVAPAPARLNHEQKARCRRRRHVAPAERFERSA